MWSHKHDVFLSRECSGIIKTSHAHSVSVCLHSYLLPSGAPYALLLAQNSYQTFLHPWRAWALFLFCLLLNSVDMAGPGKQFQRMCTVVSSALRWENVWQPSTQTRVFSGMLMGLTVLTRRRQWCTIFTCFFVTRICPGFHMSLTKLRFQLKKCLSVKDVQMINRCLRFKTKVSVKD